MNVVFEGNSQYFDVEFNQESSGWEVEFDNAKKTIYYDGEYEITPSLDEQTLETANKTMLDDVTVHQIQITRTSNPEGGLTVLIG